jgi:hypothetical protein
MGELVESAKKTMRDKGKYSILIPLLQRLEGQEVQWMNTFPREGGKSIRILYTCREGLLIDDANSD